jgi:hypothetical protein
MKLFLILVVVALVVVLFVADYKWRKWMAERRRNRE